MFGRNKKTTAPAAPSAREAMPMMVMPPEYVPGGSASGGSPAAPAGRKSSLLLWILAGLLVVVAGTAVVFYFFRDQLLPPVATVNPAVNTSGGTAVNTSAAVNTPVTNAALEIINTNVATLPDGNLNGSVNSPVNNAVGNANSNTNVGLNVNTETNTNLTPAANQNSTTNAPTSPVDASAALDIDSDSLIAAEEQLWATNPSFADTDSDGFLDGQEILNGYSPVRAKEPLETGRDVQEFANTQQSYRVRYPSGILFRSVDDAAADIVLTLPQGGYFEITVQPNAANLTAVAWYQKLDPTQNVSQIRRRTLAGVAAAISRDGNSVYVPQDGKMITLTYVPGSDGLQLYPLTFQYLYASLQFGAVAAATPTTNTNTNTAGTTPSTP